MLIKFLFFSLATRVIFSVHKARATKNLLGLALIPHGALTASCSIHVQASSCAVHLYS